MNVATALLMHQFYQNLLGKRPGLDRPMGKAAALAEAKRWLRELPAAEAAERRSALTCDKDEVLVSVKPATDQITSAAPDSRPLSHPRYWAAFILVGDPD